MTRILPVIESPTLAPSATMKAPVAGPWSDWLGMIAAIGCAIHCAAMPFVIAYLPLFGLSFLADEGFHQWMAVGCFVIAISAFVPGFRKHKRWTPACLGSVGLILISIAAFGPCSAECCHPIDSTPGNTAANFAAGDCQDADCEHCETESSELVTISENHPAKATLVASLSPPWLVLLMPWLTPVGGFVLVTAHLVNRRQCSCCRQ